MIIYKVSSQHWEDNLKLGTRIIKVYFEDRHIVTIRSNHIEKENKWECRIIPMGFSYGASECDMLIKLLNDTKILIPVLEKKELDSYDLIKICDGL